MTGLDIFVQTISEHQQKFTTGSKCSGLVKTMPEQKWPNIIDTGLHFQHQNSKLQNLFLRGQRTTWLCLSHCHSWRALCAWRWWVPQCDSSVSGFTNERQAYRRWSIDWWLIWMPLNAAFNSFHCLEGYLLQLVSHSLLRYYCLCCLETEMPTVTQMVTHNSKVKNHCEGWSWYQYSFC